MAHWATAANGYVANAIPTAQIALATTSSTAASSALHQAAERLMGDTFGLTVGGTQSPTAVARAIKGYVRYTMQAQTVF